MDDPGHMADVRLSRLNLGYPGLAAARKFCVEVEALDNIGEISQEILEMQFTIPENLEAELLLLGEQTKHIFVLGCSQPLGIAWLPGLPEVRADAEWPPLYCGAFMLVLRVTVVLC